MIGISKISDILACADRSIIEMNFTASPNKPSVPASLKALRQEVVEIYVSVFLPASNVAKLSSLSQDRLWES
jgi:hypothetical protein